MPKKAFSHIEELGFKQVKALPNTFIGSLPSQVLNAPFTVLLSAIPLQLQNDKYVFSLTYNGSQAFAGRLGSLEDLTAWLFSFGVIEDIDLWRNGKAEK